MSDRPDLRRLSQSLKVAAGRIENEAPPRDYRRPRKHSRYSSAPWLDADPRELVFGDEDEDRLARDRWQEE